MAELNQLNQFIQEEHKLLIDTVDKMSAFNDKLRHLNTRVEENKIASFTNLNHILEEANVDSVHEKLKEIVPTQLKNLSVQFKKCIPKNTKEFG